MKSFSNSFFIFFFIYFQTFPSIPPGLCTDDFKIIPTSIHAHSHFSSGARSIPEMAKIAQEQSVKVLILTDHYLEHYEYGVGPLKGIFKKNFDRESIMKKGIDSYLNSIAEANQRHPDVLIIDGTAVTPFHFWSGGLWPGPLILNNRGKDLLVLGLGNPEKYRSLPVVGNGKSEFDPYAGDAYAKPYQQFIDSVNKAEGLVFWSHPQASEHMAINNVIFGLDVYLDTQPYEEALLNTFRYDGFGVFPTELAMIHHPESQSTVSPNGAWDRVLQEFCASQRKNPAWAIGEADYNGFPNGIRAMDGILNMVLVPALDRTHILSALKKGRLYIIVPASHTERILLDEFSVSNGVSGKKAGMGEGISLTEPPLIHVRAHLSEDAIRDIHVTLIRNQRVIAEWNESLPFDIKYQDEGNHERGKSYYRIIMASDNSPHRLLTNPIFTERQ